MLSVVLFAQDARLGFKGGLNIAHLNNNNNNEWGSRVGFNAGILAHIHLDPNLAVQPELVYSSQGTKYTPNNREHNLRLDYVNIPVLLQYMFSNGFRLETGPQLGFLVNVKERPNGAEPNFTSDDFKAVDFAWSAGLGYVSASGLGIDARYNFGLSNINDAGTNVLHNSVFQVGLFYELKPQRHATHARRRR
jgi:hypothetical protein